ncbi:MAG: hypothetical protein AB7E32_17050 [Desulfovibrio sp.]
MYTPSPYACPTPTPGLGLCLGLCLGLLLAAQASAMGPRPDELPRFAGDTHQTVYEHYSSAQDGRLLSYTLVAQFSGCPDQAGFDLEVDGDRPVVLLPGVEQVDRGETCLHIAEIRRGEDTGTLHGRLAGCERGDLTATIPVDCPEGCSPPEILLRHDCAYAETWVAGQPEIMDNRTAPRELGWIDGPRQTLAGFHFLALKPGTFQIIFSRDQDADLEVLAVHFVSNPEDEHTARIESLGAEENVYSAVVYTPGEYELLVLLASEDPLEHVEGRVVPATPVAPTAVRTDYAAATVPEEARTGNDGFFSFAVDQCAGAWARRHGLCPPELRPEGVDK